MSIFTSTLLFLWGSHSHWIKAVFWYDFILICILNASAKIPFPNTFTFIGSGIRALTYLFEGCTSTHNTRIITYLLTAPDRGLSYLSLKLTPPSFLFIISLKHSFVIYPSSILYPCNSKYGPPSGSIHSTWELVKMQTLSYSSKPTDLGICSWTGSPGDSYGLQILKSGGLNNKNLPFCSPSFYTDEWSWLLWTHNVLCLNRRINHYTLFS